MAKLFSRAFISVGGVRQASLPGSLKFSLGGYERSPIMGDVGLLGSTSKLVNSTAEFDIAVGPDTDLVALGNSSSVITIEADSGQIFVMRDAELAAPVEVQSGEGKASLKFFGKPMEQGS